MSIQATLPLIDKPAQRDQHAAPSTPRRDCRSASPPAACAPTASLSCATGCAQHHARAACASRSAAARSSAPYAPRSRPTARSARRCACPSKPVAESASRRSSKATTSSRRAAPTPSSAAYDDDEASAATTEHPRGSGPTKRSRSPAHLCAPFNKTRSSAARIEAARRRRRPLRARRAFAAGTPGPAAMISAS